MQRKMALLELSNEADFFGFVTKNYIIPGIRTGEHSITFPIDHAYFQIYTLKIDSLGAHEHREMTAVLRGSWGCISFAKQPLEAPYLLTSAAFRSYL